MAFGVSPRTAEDLARSRTFHKAMTSHGSYLYFEAGDARCLADNALRGDKDLTDRLRRVAPEHGAALPEPFGALLRHHGIDPDAALGLSILAGERGLGILRDVASDNPRQIAHIALARRDMTWVSLGDLESSWRMGEILVPRIPETLAAALVGAPLGRLLSHPVLDRIDIAITAVHDCWDDEKLSEVVTSLHPPSE